MTRQTLIFLHIPKCAGSTFTAAVARQFLPSSVYQTCAPFEKVEERFALLSNEARSQIQLIAGHVGYGIHELLPQASQYITMLREPKDRLRSEYFFARENRDHPHYAKINNENLSLIQYVDSGISRHFDNCQTRMLSGRPETHWLNGDQPCDEEDLSRACRHLAQRFRWIGLTERFEESFAGLCLNMGWPMHEFRTINVTKSGRKLDSLTQYEMEILAAHNRFDLQLYAFAETLFQKQVDSLGDSLSRAMRLARLGNLWKKRFDTVKWRLRRLFWFGGPKDRPESH